MAKNLIQCIFLVFAFNAEVFCQKEIDEFHTSLLSPTAAVSISLGGNIDFFNSFVLLPSPKNYKGYQNLVEISLTNSDSIPIKNPFVSLNGSRLWKYSSEIENVYIGNSDFNRAALLIWRTFTDQSIHRVYPIYDFRSGTAIDLLTTFGYGMCYNKAAAVARLPFNSRKSYYALAANKHAISEFSIGNEAAIIDTDLVSFYLNLSNSKLSSKDVISKDRYLIKRTHHYGRQYEFDKTINEYVASFYSPNPNLNFEIPLSQSEFSLRYDLVPGENMTLDYSRGKYYFSDTLYNTHSTELANGYFSYDWNIASNNHFLKKENLRNVNVKGKRIFKTNPELPGSINLQLNHGFQIAFFEFSLDLGKKYFHPPIAMEISQDSLKWVKPTRKILSGNIIKYRFDLKKTYVKGKVFVRILLNGDKVEIRNFGYKSYFQINRLALPQLKLGSNSLQVLHDNKGESLFTVDVKYKEKTSLVPMSIQRPEFPLNGQVVYGPLKELSWTYPGESGDIVNYEFNLTKDTLTHLPLCPNFSAYTNTVNAYKPLPRNWKMSRKTKKRKTINKFVVHEEGFLNSGESYFWRVRPYNSQGVWGPWSRYFSFQMQKVMPAVNLTASERELTWDPNPSGSSAKSFEVYGSNEYLGFEPKPTDLISITSEKRIRISDVRCAFFRVIAVDSLGNKSEISEYASRPYPYLKEEPPNVYPDCFFEYKLLFTPVFFSIVADAAKRGHVDRLDAVKFNILKMPPWLKFNSENSTIEGIANENVLRNELDTGENLIELELFSEILPARKYSLELQYGLKAAGPK